MSRAKLEFYRFQIKPKKEGFKTFRDFAIEELKVGKNPTVEKVMNACFKHFVDSLKTDVAKDEHLKKKLCIEKKSTINKHHDKKPSFDSASFTISGVINGGPYGRERIISNNDDEDDSTSLGLNKAVLLYFYVFIYLPPDHNEGFFMIHSNSADESITVLFRKYITKIFKGENFNTAVPEEFCPSTFQEEFKDGSVLKNLVFKTSFIDTIHTTDGISQLLNEYDIKIEATPKNKVGVSKASAFFEKLIRNSFGSKEKKKQLKNFDRKTLVVEDANGNSRKTFEWNTLDNSFVPVVYLKGKIKKENADGTPDFEELKTYCKTLFENEILPEIRPDLNVQKSD